ncbi:MAG TPA: VIT1/CCC1 transporter family protein [Candidatus Levybacteria bacterium]|nr:VIT1/CCC1 transporter family protein [Candidatus Levybacteria bacterium]
MDTKTYTAEEFDQHLNREHRLSAFSTYLKEIVYGGVDGIVTTFAVVAGFTGAQTGDSTITALSVTTVLLFGFANLFADGVSMGLGNILSVRADQDVYRREKEKERKEIKKNRSAEIAETVFILKQEGFNDKQARSLTEIYATNEEYWLKFMMNNELEMTSPENDKPVLTGLSTFVSFILFGAIPIFPYVFLRHDPNIFVISSVATAGALIMLGILRYRVTKETLTRSVGEVVLLGGLSSFIAYLVGTFFRA